MKDGNYDLCFSADGYVGRGSLSLDGAHASGSDGRLKLDGNVLDGSRHVTAVFNVSTAPRLIGNALIPDHYSLQMTGTATETDFSLIGTGPLGLIVEITCSYVGPAPFEHA
jgi:hypothetical protein